MLILTPPEFALVSPHVPADQTKTSNPSSRELKPRMARGADLHSIWWSHGCGAAIGKPQLWHVKDMGLSGGVQVRLPTVCSMIYPTKRRSPQDSKTGDKRDELVIPPHEIWSKAGASYDHAERSTEVLRQAWKQVTISILSSHPLTVACKICASTPRARD